MSIDTSFLIGLLLFVAAASGFWLARLQQRNSIVARSDAVADSNVFRGLRFLVDDNPDKAIEVFTELVEVDSETLETHFVLGNLFRRRGETDRAIRIHQNIIARPELPRTERERALFALAEDYLHAGLLDRAEKLFLETAATKSLDQASLANLVGIYERQKDWQQAIDIRLRWARLRGKSKDPVTAHYYCELASESMLNQDAKSARDFLRKARQANPEGVRGALLRASLAENLEDYVLARKLLVRVAVKNRPYARVAINRLASSCRKADAKDELPRLLKNLLDHAADLSLPIAHAVILDRQMDDQVSLGCFEQYLRNDRILGAILEALESRPGYENLHAAPEILRRIRVVLRRLAMDGPRFGCVACGFTSRTISWRCRGCLSWDSTLPTANLKFDSHLGSAGYIQ